MKSRYLLFFLILIYIISPCTATGDYKFRTMSPSGGFYYDGIKAIEQDKEGFIWTMMDYELYRFDGYHYKKYYPYFASMAPTKRWIFNNMASDLVSIRPRACFSPSYNKVKSQTKHVWLLTLL